MDEHAPRSVLSFARERLSRPLSGAQAAGVDVRSPLGGRRIDPPRLALTTSGQQSSSAYGPLDPRTAEPHPARKGGIDALPCFYSSAVEGDLSKLLGVPHYSYRFAESKFLRAFKEHGRPLTKIPMPEYYSTSDSLPTPIPAGVMPLHLIFRSTEQVRLMKHGYNICCFAWEFEVLKDYTLPNEHPFLNQKRMLSICDEIWAPCDFTKQVLTAHEIGNVHVIPAPIPVPSEPRMARYDALTVIGHVGVMPLIHNFLRPHDENARACAAKSQSLLDWVASRRVNGRDPSIYLSVLNPEDFRKNLDALIRGFYHFQSVNPNACLIVKVLTSSERFTLDRVISEVIPNKLASGSMLDCENIVFVNRYLTDEEMSALFYLSDFYICTSRAEGQNLPLLEAMAHGTVPVSTRNTAMADYIDTDCAFVIEEQFVPAMTLHLAGSISGKPFRIHDSSSRDVFEALVRSSRASQDEWEAMSDAARAAVERRFAPETVWPKIEERLAAIYAEQVEA